jgi:phosphoribosylamine---glycine ligase
MKFLMVSEDGIGAHILKMIENEGNEVSLYIKRPDCRDMWSGLLPKAKKVAPTRDTVVIFDTSGFGKLADKLRKSGVPVVGGSAFADRLEEDRQFGLDLMVEAGIKVPFSKEFDKFDGIEDFLGAHEGIRFVFKPSGKNLPSFLTYVSCDGEDLLEYVAYVEKNYGKDVESFVLQEFVEGVAVSTELWCDGERFIRPAIHDLELKAFMDGCLGPATGCAGNLIWIEDGSCRISSNGLAKVESQVVDAGHVGPMDLNAIVNDEGVWGLEWTPRFGYDSTPVQMPMFNREIGQFFSDIARGQLDYDMPLKDEFGAGVRFSIPPYPLEPHAVVDAQKVRPNGGIPIRGLTEKNAGSFFFYEVMEEDGKLIHCPGTGILGVAMGVSSRPREAWDLAYDALSSLKVPELQYRLDLSEKICSMYRQVEAQDGVSVGTIPEIELEEAEVEEDEHGQ